MRRLRLALATLGVLALPLIATTAHASVTPQAAPTAAQLLAKANSCSVVSKSKYKTDSDVSSATVNICKSGTAYFWKADMDIDCDGITTSNCNKSKDPWYQPQTSFQTSKGKSFQADKTHYFVIPLPSSRFSYSSAGIKPGTVAAVIYNNKVVYAVFADEGPNDIIGEASYATARDLGINPDPANGGVDSGVTYIVFTGNVPSPVEDNNAITAKGEAAATAWLNG
ncbi:glycoside hydrolase family 75 protein [Planosporangium sp. 12N6]|uniref:glycoside hydrolase family 75 protein n=1 Tax=Planosporangium spinosum TaxID=3402278 RepID=UPI003CEB5082